MQPSIRDSKARGTNAPACPAQATLVPADPQPLNMAISKLFSPPAGKMRTEVLKTLRSWAISTRDCE